MTAAYREIDGLGVIVREGTTLPIVLLHGIGSRAASWRPLFDAWPEASFIAWDAPGYGASAPLSSASPTAADYALALDGLCSALGLQRIFLVGHSLGALVAAAFACLHPPRVAGMLLADPARGYGERSEREKQQLASRRLEAFMTLGAADHARERAPKLLSDTATPTAYNIVLEGMSALTEAGYRPAVALLAHGDLAADLATYGGPLTIVSGAEDKVVPPANTRALSEAFAAPFKTILGAGHACYVEQPDAFAGILQKAVAAVGS